MHRRVSLPAGVAAALATAMVAAAPTAATPPIASPGPSQATVALRMPLTAYTTPAPFGRRITTVPARRPVTNTQTVLPMTGSTVDADGTRWVKVMLPGRPNGRQGWVRRQGLELGATSWRVRVDTSERRVRVLRNGRLVRAFSAVVGKPSTPTPRGDFFVEESVRMPAERPGAPFALLLSARSEVLQEFEGGTGQIAIHGVRNLGGKPGTAVSHGCIRLGDAAIRWLASHVGPGVPVTVTQ